MKTGIELLRSAVNHEELGMTLQQVLMEHLLTGKSVDDILGLKSNGKSPRRTLLLQLRGYEMLRAWRYLRDTNNLSDRQASFCLYEMIYKNEEPPDELEESISVIQTYSSILNLTHSSPEALYNAINDLNFQLKNM